MSSPCLEGLPSVFWFYRDLCLSLSLFCNCVIETEVNLWRADGEWGSLATLSGEDTTNYHAEVAGFAPFSVPHCLFMSLLWNSLWTGFSGLLVFPLTNELIKALTHVHFIYVWMSWLYLFKNYPLIIPWMSTYYLNVTAQNKYYR